MINRFLLLGFILFTISVHAQSDHDLDEKRIKEKVDQFFVALEKQDTIMLKKLWFQEGQVWAIDQTKEPMSYSMRFFKEDLKRFDPKVILQERALSYEIKIQKGMAMAWIPYDFHVNGSFSHCGVDIFSLLKTEGDWKFISASYTVEKEGCQK